MSKQIGWYLLAFAQVFLIFKNLPRIAKTAWPYLYDCLIADKNNSKVMSFQVNYDEKTCHLLPGDIKLTVVQFLITYVTVIGTVLVYAILGVYYVIYKLEIPFIERFKIDKDKEWPWKTN